MPANLPQNSPNAIWNVNYCKNFQYDFDENIPLSTVFGICFFLGMFLVFAGTLSDLPFMDYA